ncbi:thiosulfate oxidation carrier complex protein SoxZ [Limobrevibacterium gyesilva]|uniref:Thiosulfate oxidation carrier complex protein SoxZ n=1 Tax=Limobrevibacterium gyesilva TaxID=2991712 RepID=A0AA42CGJ7_9PROT|nr:thiosulfate oxidation carrier complex protein SoxZ [Limobrevibacterium gyesilva]MCW3473915.1 thiosulfate oxidation carrier complex protein SoxZ [Limobrevibacterium gyesilva]
MARTLINVPRQVKRGEVFDIKVLIAHPMESGQRRDNLGRIIPRDIINSFVCTYSGEEVFRAELFPAIAANPFLSFSAVAVDSGTIELRWTDDHGSVQSESVAITVE